MTGTLGEDAVQAAARRLDEAERERRQVRMVSVVELFGRGRMA